MKNAEAEATRHDAWCDCTLCIVKRQDATDRSVMARLRAPFGCEFIPSANAGRWRIHDANDDAIASVSGREEGYARLIVQALNEHCARK